MQIFFTTTTVFLSHLEFRVFDKAMASSWWEGEWELCNDDGFVYKRRKRHRDSSSAPAGPAVSPLLLDADAELRQRRAQKKKILLKVREQYGGEIRQWEALLAALQEMKEKTQSPPSPRLPPPQESALQAPNEGTVFRPMIDELLLQAEAQEAFLQDMTNLCDIAETMCKVQEDRFKQSFIDLPVWSTPLSLMTSLTEVDDG